MRSGHGPDLGDFKSHCVKRQAASLAGCGTRLRLRQEDGERFRACLRQNAEALFRGPQDESGVPIEPLDFGANVAARLGQAAFVRLPVPDPLGWHQFVGRKFKLPVTDRTKIRMHPIVELASAFIDVVDFVLVVADVIDLVHTVVSEILHRCTLVDMNDRGVQGAAGLRSGRDQDAADRRVDVLQCFE